MFSIFFMIARPSAVTGVRYIDRVTGEEYEQPADVVVLSSFTMSNTRFLLMAGIGTPYSPKTGQVGSSAKISATRQCLARVSSSRTAGSIRSSGVWCVTDRDRRVQRRQFRPQRVLASSEAALHLRQRDERDGRLRVGLFRQARAKWWRRSW